MLGKNFCFFIDTYPEKNFLLTIPFIYFLPSVLSFDPQYFPVSSETVVTIIYFRQLGKDPTSSFLYNTLIQDTTYITTVSWLIIIVLTFVETDAILIPKVIISVRRIEIQPNLFTSFLFLL